MKYFTKSLLYFLSGCILGAMVGYLGGEYGNPFSIKRVDIWSIGIEEGITPFQLETPDDFKNPVLTVDDINDVNSLFVADPFILVVKNAYYMFFEVFNVDTNQGDIGLAISNDTKKWNYQGIVLDEKFHLSYPFVFVHDNSYYMIPESHKNSSIRLYKARNFPKEWKYIGTLLSGYDFVDSTILQHLGKWWIFVSSKNNAILRLYYSDKLTGPWVEHPESPIIKNDITKARPAGRIIKVNNTLYRISQSAYPRYGSEVNAFQILDLNEKSYMEIPYGGNPILKKGIEDWNNLGMHHMDPHQNAENRWFACVDGLRERWLLKIGTRSFLLPELISRDK